MGSEETRRDSDGKWYTKAEFVQCYGGTAEWDKAHKKTPPKPSEPERRVSAEDGCSYTKQEFIDYYGGTAEWERAKPEKKNKEFVKDLSLFERRIAADGKTYTKKQFLEFYGDLVEWNKAKSLESAAPGKSGANSGQTSHSSSAQSQKPTPKSYSAASSQVTTGGQPTGGDHHRTRPGPPPRANDGIERRLAPNGVEWLSKEEYVECYSLEEWYAAEAAPKEEMPVAKLPEASVKRIAAEARRLEEVLINEFQPIYSMVQMEPGSLSTAELAIVESEFKKLMSNEEKCLMVAKQYAAFLSQRSVEFLDRKQLSGFTRGYIEQFEYQLKAARAEFGDMQTERLEGIKHKMKMLYRIKDGTWMKWRGKTKELEDQIKLHGADPNLIKKNGKIKQKPVVNPSGAKPGAAADDVKKLFIQALKQLVRGKKTPFPFNASLIMDEMLQMKGKRFTMKETPYSTLKNLLNAMQSEGHITVNVVGSSLTVTGSMYAP